MLRNRGDAHIRIRALRLRPENGDGVIEPAEPAAYVLAGGEHAWRLPAGALRKSRRFVLEAESQVGPISIPLVAEGS